MTPPGLHNQLDISGADLARHSRSLRRSLSPATGCLGIGYESVYPPQRRAQTHHQRCVTDAGPQLREQLHQTVAQFEPPVEAQVLIEGWRIDHNTRARMHPWVTVPGA